MNNKQRHQRVEKAKTRILFHVPFFFAGAARLGDVIWDESIPTACTNGKRVQWNPIWFDSLKDGEVVTVLCEEVGHCLFQHLWRRPVQATPLHWNLACDQVLRNMMVDMNEQAAASGNRQPFPFPDPQHTLPDRKFKGMAEEAVCKLLPKPPPNGGGGEGSLGEFEPAKGEDADGQSQWERVAIQSAAMAKQQGRLPADLERLVREMVAPTLPWWEIVANWLREYAHDDWDWSVPNPVYDDSGFILPAMHSERLGAGVFAKDTSGSIQPETLARFVAVQQAFMDELRPTKLVDLCCDAAITQEREYRPGDTIDLNAPGGGGTDFRPVFQRAEELAEQGQVRVLVYLTDLEGTFPEKEPPFPVIWVVWGGKETVPFGTVVKVEA